MRDAINYDRHFLSARQTPDGAEAIMARDKTGSIAVSMHDGRARRMPVPPSERTTSWVLGESGRLAALRYPRWPRSADLPQHLALWSTWWAGRSTNLSLTGGTADPDLALLDVSPSGRWLVALQGSHVLANTNWFAVEVVRIDARTGTERLLPIRSSEFGGILSARGAYGRPWRPGGRDELLLVGQPVDPAADSAIGPHVEISRLALLDLAHPQLRWLTDERLRVTAPAWSPDGRQIAFAAQDAERPIPDTWPMLGLEDTYAARRGMSLHLLDLETNALRRLTEPGDGWDSGPEWSADGSRVLYMRGFDPDISPETGSPAGLSRKQVRVLILNEGRDELLLDHVGSDWAWSEGAIDSP
jgi:hypothetical protein